MVVAKVAAGDAVMSFLWVFLNAGLRASVDLAASHIGIYGNTKQAIKRAIVVALLFLFYWLGKTLGGASYNPVTVIAYTSVRLTNLPFYSLAMRLPAQVIGSILGAFAAVGIMPNAYKNTVGGPYLRVDPHMGALAEGLLTFAIVFIVLAANFRGPKSGIRRTWITSISRVSLSIMGTEYTGPAMNPANVSLLPDFDHTILFPTSPAHCPSSFLERGRRRRKKEPCPPSLSFSQFIPCCPHLDVKRLLPLSYVGLNEARMKNYGTT